MIALLKRGAVLGQALVDRANPLLVRHVRQELRNRGFIGIFMLLLLAAVLASLFMAGTAIDRSEGEAGRWLFGLLGVCLTFALWVAQPIGAFRAMMRERDDDTWDLIDLTGMRPGQILRGILQATLVQGALYTAAIAPFMVMAYLLRGLDILTVILATTWLVLVGIQTTAFAIFWGCLGPNKATRAVLFVLLILMLMIGWLSSMVPVFALAAGELADLFAMDQWEHWVFMGFWLNAWVDLLVLQLVLAATLLTFRAGNRSTPLRLTWLGIALNGVIWTVGAGMMFGPSDWYEEGLLIVGVGLTVWALPLGMFAGTEDRALTPRQLRWLDEGGRLARFGGWFLGPGEARGTMSFLLLAIVAAIAAIVGGLMESEEDVMAVCLMLLGHCCFYLALTQFLARGWLKDLLDTPASKRVLFLALMIAASVAQLMVNLVVDDGFPPLNVLSPVWCAIFAAGEFRGMDQTTELINAVGMVIVGAAGVALLLASMVRGMGRTVVARVHARDSDHNPRGG